MKKLIFMTLTGLAVAATANAEIYVQGDLGYAKVKIPDIEYSDNGTFNDSSFSPSIAIGYKMGNWRAALDYTYYGNFKQSYTDTDNNNTKGELKLKFQGIGISTFYDFQLNSDFTPYVGIRLASNRMKWNDYYEGEIEGDGNGTLTRFGYGAVVGVSYALSSELALNAAAEYNRLGNYEGAKINQYGVKVGLRYTF